MAYTQITYDVRDSVATITLDRPDRLNAYSHTMARELVDAADAADNDEQVRVVLLTANGRAFCAGADLDPEAGEFSKERASEVSKERPADELFEDGRPRDAGGLASLRLAALRKPLIVAVNGAAVGIGATLTLPADIRIAGTSARFGFIFTRRGLIPEAGSTWFLPRLVGMARATEWVTTARIFGADEALAAGLVSQVCDDDELLANANALASRIALEVAPVAFAAAKLMMWGMWSSPDPWAAHRLESRVLEELHTSDDFAEGVSAFLERRPARFTGDPQRELSEAIPAWLDYSP